MKKAIIILIGTLAGGLSFAQNLSTEEIVSNYLKAKGQDKFMNMETVKMTGKVTQQGLEILVTEYSKKPDKVKAEMEVQGMKVIMSMEGDTGWIINPMMGVTDAQDLNADAIIALKKETNNDPTTDWDMPFINYKEKGIIIESGRTEDVNGIPAYNLKFTFKEGYFFNYIIDTKSFLLLESRTTENIQGQTYDREVRFSDYRDFNGILVPGKYEMLVNGQIGQIFTLDNCEFNIPIDDSIFKKPVKE